VCESVESYAPTSRDDDDDHETRLRTPSLFGEVDLASSWALAVPLIILAATFVIIFLVALRDAPAEHRSDIIKALAELMRSIRSGGRGGATCPANGQLM
jgi:hypothetical protein